MEEVRYLALLAMLNNQNYCYSESSATFICVLLMTGKRDKSMNILFLYYPSSPATFQIYKIWIVVEKI